MWVRYYMAQNYQSWYYMWHVDMSENLRKMLFGHKHDENGKILDNNQTSRNCTPRHVDLRHAQELDRTFADLGLEVMRIVLIPGKNKAIVHFREKSRYQILEVLHRKPVYIGEFFFRSFCW